MAYRSILAARRRAHHARIVEIIEAQPAEEQERDLDDLCQHAVQAQLLAKAVGLLQRAARTSEARRLRTALRASVKKVVVGPTKPRKLRGGKGVVRQFKTAGESSRSQVARS